jgi:hypothetical protein
MVRRCSRYLPSIQPLEMTLGARRRVILSDRSMAGSWSKMLPASGGEGMGYSKPFRLLLRAVREVIGGRSFG